MSKTNAPTRSPKPTSSSLRRWAGLILVGWLMALFPARAQVADDQYVAIYNIVQQADELSEKGKNEAALAKYKDALAGLQAFQVNYRTWNPRVVAFRLNDVSEKIKVLNEKLSPTTVGTPASSTPAGAPASKGGPGQVKLLDAGGEPRKVLRVHPNPGDKQTVSMTMKIAMDISAAATGGQAIKMPPLMMPLETTVKSVSSDGEIAYDVALGEITVGEDPSAVPQMVEAMKAALAALKPPTGSGTMTSRRVSKGPDLKVSTGDAQTRQIMDQAKGLLAMAAPPLPEEAVGPGAKWEVKGTSKEQGMTIDQTAVYELVSVEDERVTTKGTITLSAANQKIENPAMPGLKMDLTKLTGKATADVTFDLTKLQPEMGTIDQRADFSMSMNMGAQKQAMTMKMSVKLTLTGK